MNTRSLSFFGLAFICATHVAWGQYPVRGLPEANRVYAYGGYSAYAPVGQYVPPQVGYPVGMPQANTAYYAPQPQANTAYYPPQPSAMSAYYSPVSNYTPSVNYAYRPTTYGSSLIPPTNPGVGYGVPGVSPFVRPQPNYSPPVYTYRPATATLPVTYYRPVTVYDPVSGVPVTYMSGCTGKECYTQPQRTWAGYFQHHKKPCTNGSCCGPQGCAPAAVPYYPTPGPVVPGATIPSATIPSTTAPGTFVYPSAQPPLPRTTVPPPATISPSPGGFITPSAPSTFGAPAGGVDPANSRPNLNTPPTNLGPAGLPPAGGSFNPGPTTTNYPPTDQQPTTDGKSYYYYKGVVREPFSNQPSSGTAPGTSQFNTQRPDSSQPMMQQQVQPMMPQQNPGLNTPQNVAPKAETGTSFRGFAPPDGYRSDLRPSGIGSDAANKPVVTTPNGPPVAPEFKPNLIPIIRPPVTDIRPVPDPEPTRPINRAPQLLNPRDKTA